MGENLMITALWVLRWLHLAFWLFGLVLLAYRVGCGGWLQAVLAVAILGSLIDVPIAQALDAWNPLVMLWQAIAPVIGWPMISVSF